jgi:hypothetical protein
MDFRKFSQDLKRDVRIIFRVVIVGFTLQVIIGLWRGGYFTPDEQILLCFAGGLVVGGLVYLGIKPWTQE